MEEEVPFLSLDMLKYIIVSKYTAPREKLLMINAGPKLRSFFDAYHRNLLIIEIAFPSYRECKHCQTLVKKQEMNRHVKLGKCLKAMQKWGINVGFFCPTCRVPHRISWKRKADHGPGRCGDYDVKKYPSARCDECGRKKFYSQLHVLSKYCNMMCYGRRNVRLLDYTSSTRITHYFGAGNFLLFGGITASTWNRTCRWCSSKIDERSVTWVDDMPVALEFGHACTHNCPNVRYCSVNCKKKHWKLHQYECLE